VALALGAGRGVVAQDRSEPDVRTRILTRTDVEALLPMRDCIEVMARTLRATARGEAINPLRTALRFPDGRGLVGLMPAQLASPPCAGVKIVTVMPGNHGTPYDSHQGAVVLFETEHGCPIAMIDASSVTMIRTAAVSALATRLLAREAASTLAMLGSGVQASSHLAAMREVRAIDRVRVWSRTRANADAFAKKEVEKHGIPIEAAPDAESAVADADIVCTTTSAKEPVLKGAWLTEGTHVNAVGACFRSFRELDTEAVRRARLFVDRRESALHEAGDFLIPLEEGAIAESHIRAEIGELLLGTAEGRGSPSEITIFKSLGIGVEDLGAAHHLWTMAERLGRGGLVDFRE
jgi:ornithine cyclodeaminase